MSADELFDVVDADDRVLRQEPRSVVHAQKLLHRAVHVFLFNSRQELLVQRRSATKDEYPLTYTSSASGHLAAGENYDDCAPREMQEEIGIAAELAFITKLPASEETSYEHTALYQAVSDAVPSPDEQEVASVTFFTVPELMALLSIEPEKFSPAFATLLRWYAAHCTPPTAD